MPDPAAPQPRQDPEIIEGGDVERVTDVQFEERKHRAATSVTLATVSRAHALGKRLVIKIVDPPTLKRKLAKAAAS